MNQRSSTKNSKKIETSISIKEYLLTFYFSAERFSEERFKAKISEYEHLFEDYESKNANLTGKISSLNLELEQCKNLIDLLQQEKKDNDSNSPTPSKKKMKLDLSRTNSKLANLDTPQPSSNRKRNSTFVFKSNEPPNSTLKEEVKIKKEEIPVENLQTNPKNEPETEKIIENSSQKNVSIILPEESSQNPPEKSSKKPEERKKEQKKKSFSKEAKSPLMKSKGMRNSTLGLVKSPKGKARSSIAIENPKEEIIQKRFESKECNTEPIEEKEEIRREVEEVRIIEKIVEVVNVVEKFDKHVQTENETKETFQKKNSLNTENPGFARENSLKRVSVENEEKNILLQKKIQISSESNDFLNTSKTSTTTKLEVSTGIYELSKSLINVPSSKTSNSFNNLMKPTAISNVTLPYMQTDSFFHSVKPKGYLNPMNMTSQKKDKEKEEVNNVMVDKSSDKFLKYKEKEKEVIVEEEEQSILAKEVFSQLNKLREENNDAKFKYLAKYPFKKIQEFKPLIEETQPENFAEQFVKSKNEINFETFKNIFLRLVEAHKKCGKNCKHLQKFYRAIGLTSFVNKRELLSLSKQVIHKLPKI